jgi:rubrerythrin
MKRNKTEENLLVSFSVKSQERNRYYFSSNKTHKEECKQISVMFQEKIDVGNECTEIFSKFVNTHYGLLSK